jgi:hypothetical protein
MILGAFQSQKVKKRGFLKTFYIIPILDIFKMSIFDFGQDFFLCFFGKINKNKNIKRNKE